MTRRLTHLVRNAFRPRHVRAAVAPEQSIADLLGRRPVNLDTPELQRFLAGKRVLVTGAGGSIGSEICRQLMRFCPGRLVLLDRAENSLFDIDRELREQWVGSDLSPCVADVCDAPRIAQVFAAESPQVIFHCAAHKHVPMMEHNPGEAVKNNVFGTKTVADAALACGAGAFVLVSTDKAVNPTSVMGATKRVAELYVQSLNGSAVRGPLSVDARDTTDNGRRTTDTPRFLAVRFGNVLGSSGSVVPIFAKQIDAGGPVTVTHPEMKRYFMTIPEASQLVMQAGAIGRGGEIFVLDMGEPLRIVDLALDMIRRRGLTVGEDIELRFTGVRPGEKLYEQLAADDDAIRPTAHEKIRVWELPRPSPHQLCRALEQLAFAAADGRREVVVAALRQAVPEYAPPDVTQAADADRAALTERVPALRLVPPESAAA